MCASEAQDANQIIEESAPVIENTVQQSTDKFQQAMTSIENWLGNNIAQPIRNKAGDFVLRNVENTKKFRFDFYNTDPHLNPHLHLEWINELGEWMNSGPIYPTDVLPK